MFSPKKEARDAQDKSNDFATKTEQRAEGPRN